MEYDGHNDVKGVVALDTAAITTDTTTVGNIVDTLGFETAEFFIQSGTLTDGTYTVILEDGDDSGLSDAAVIAAEFRLGSLPDFALTDDDTVFRVGSISKKRFQRLSLLSAATTTGGTLGSTCVLGRAKSGPTAAQTT